MISARTVEYRITRGLVNRRFEPGTAEGARLARSVIGAAALAGGMLLFGSLVPELLAALLAAGALAALGSRST